MATQPACPYCAEHPPLVVENEALVAAHCGNCMASLLPAASTSQLVVHGLGMTMEAFQQLLARAAPAPVACPACQGATRLVMLRFRATHLCPACGALSLPGGTLFALTQGKFGKAKPVDPAAAAAAEQAALETPHTSGFSRFLSTMAYAGNARKLIYMTLSVVLMVVIAAVNAGRTKPVKLGKDGLPTGNMGMRPESAAAFREAMGQFGGGGGTAGAGVQAGGGKSGCPDGATATFSMSGMECRLDGKLHGTAMTDTCDEDGNGSMKQAEYRKGLKHGRVVEKNCEGTVLVEGSWVDDKPDGEHLERHPDGTPKKRQVFAAGVPHGAYAEFHPNGRPAVEGFFHNGQKAGQWTWKDASGRTTREERH